MYTTLQQRFIRAEVDFVSSLAEGPIAVESFQQSWTSLQTDFVNAVQTGSIDDSAISLAHTVASRVQILADRFLDLHTESETLSSTFKNELDDIFSRVSIAESSTTPPTSPRSRNGLAGFSAVEIPTPYPSYIPHAYKWLLDNIHNPYPSKEIRQQISQSSGNSLHHINVWFMNVRRRMGWTALAKSYFHKSRSDTVNAAYRALVKEDPDRPLDANIRMAFVLVEDAAKELYSEKLKQSVLAKELDALVMDMTNESRVKSKETKSQAIKEGKRRREKEKEARRQEAKDIKARALSSYPSPDRSPYSPDLSLLSSITDESGDDETQSALVTARKRRASSSGSTQDDFFTNRPNKRHRIDYTSLKADMSSTGLPSPLSSSDESLDTTDGCSSTSPEATLSLSFVPAPSLSNVTRKRRLSDADTQGAPKRPCNLPVGPRLQAVSDPLPMSTAVMRSSQFDSWYRLFDTPNPAAVVEELDASLLLDIEVYDYSSSNSEILVDCALPSAMHDSAVTPPSTQQIGLSDNVNARFPCLPVGDNQPMTPSDDEFNPVGSVDIFNWAPPVDCSRTMDHPAQKLSDPATHPDSEFHTAPCSFDTTPLEGSFLLNSLEEFLPLNAFPQSPTHYTSDSTAFPSTLPFSDPTAGLDWGQIFSCVPASNAVDNPSIDCTHHRPNNAAPAFNPTLFSLADSNVISTNEERAEKQRKLREYQEKIQELKQELSIV